MLKTMFSRNDPLQLAPFLNSLRPVPFRSRSNRPTLIQLALFPCPINQNLNDNLLFNVYWFLQNFTWKRKHTSSLTFSFAEFAFGNQNVTAILEIGTRLNVFFIAPVTEHPADPTVKRSYRPRLVRWVVLHVFLEGHQPARKVDVELSGLDLLDRITLHKKQSKSR